MNYVNTEYCGINATVLLSIYNNMEGGISEFNAIISSTHHTQSFKYQLEEVNQALDRVITELGPNTVPVFKRYFLSDPTNQASLIETTADCAVSVIGQAPLNGAKVVLWVYLQSDMEVRRLHNGLWSATHGHYRHLWCGGACAPELHSELATMAIFGDYVIQLEGCNCNLLDNCMRTWFFVRDIDVNYRGVVIGRNDVFRRSGLTPLTHFISSTGIGGDNADTKACVTMDAYAVDKLDPKQIKYLHASDMLNATVEYGVAFERGTAIEYGDRRHVLISGTASINNKGEVMYPGDINAQTERMLQNIKAVLNEGGADFKDMSYAIVYVRDVSDRMTVEEILKKHIGDTPRIIVHAPVCRPGWLVEMECMAIVDNNNPEFAAL